MTTYVALLRGINVGGHKKVPMAALRELLTGLGYGRVRTLLQSGNAVFTADGTDPAAVARELERSLEERFGFAVSCIVLTAEELRAVVERNPFALAEFEPSQFVVTFLSGPVGPAGSQVLRDIDPEAYLPDEFRLGEREIFLHCPTGLGRSKLAETLARAKLGVTATTRNWNTVTKLLTMTGD